MSIIERKMAEMGLSLPSPIQIPEGVEHPLLLVKVSGNHVYVSGHIAQNADGTMAMPLGKVGFDLTLDQGKEAARLTALSILGSLKRELGDLDRIESWLKVFGMVNSAQGFTDQTAVINGFSSLILEIFGEERGLATRSAVGMAELPFNVPVEIEAELKLYDLKL